MGIPTKGNLVVPVVLWGGKSPQHTISAIALAPDLQTVITGSTEGQICFWEFTSDHLSVTPKFMLYGHCGSVTCIAAASFTKPHYVSASSTGEMCLWDVKDGRCIENSKTSYINTCMQLYKFDVNKSPCLICNGTYPEILLVNPETLQLMCSLVARVHPDWINALCALKPPKAQDDIILAITKSGTIKMWSVGMQSGMAKHIYEDESKQIRCIDALLIKCCPYNQRIVLIVCSKSWQIYDAGEFSLLCSESCTPGSHWCGGDFIAVDKVIIWNNLGQAFLYKLPANKHQSKVAKPSKKLGANPERNDYHSLVGSKAVQQASPSLYCILDTNKAKIFEEASHFVCQKKAKEESYFVVRADNDGSISWWSIDSLHIPQRKDDHIPTIHSLSGYSIRELWAKTKPVGLLDLIKQHMHNEASVTCTLYVETSGQMICGLSDGNIIIIPLLQTIKFLLLQSTDDNKNSLPVFKVLTGHKARVNCLLYPNALESR